jgi:L-fucono-1,5-lactonase
MECLRRDFLIPALQAATQEAGIIGTVAVQARQSLEETRWLLDLADKIELILGVVGWVPLIEPDVTTHLETLSRHQKLKSVRHILQGEADDFFMLREDFNRGVSTLKNFDLRYDILIFERHLPQALHFVDRHPNQIFVLNHIAKPRIKDHVYSPWASNIAELARRENVYCKLSGMVTEANLEAWTESDLRPYFDQVLNVFGPRRLMFGSDWPVILLASDYKRWAGIVRSWIMKLSTTEQTAIAYGTAKSAYGL